MEEHYIKSLIKNNKLNFPNNYDDYIPCLKMFNNITEIELGLTFDNKLSYGVFPDSLEKLSFGSFYNQIIDVGVLPKKLKVLVFGNDYNQTIDEHVLPESLEHLEFGRKFKKMIAPNLLPENLKTLVFGGDYLFKLEKNVLPPNLENLTLSLKYCEILEEDSVPSTLNKLTINGATVNEILLKNLPLSSNIQILEINRLEFELDNLPVTIKKIILLSDWNKNAKDLIKKIPFGCELDIPTFKNIEIS